MANYLYNGVDLPQLPEWDKTKRKFAYIYRPTAGGNIVLRVDYGRPFHREPYISETLGAIESGLWAGFSELTDGQWTTIQDLEGYNGHSSSIKLDENDLIWSNADIYRADGSTYFPAGTTTDPTAPAVMPPPVWPTFPKGTTHCMYNDKKFAVLTEWDIRVYPYVFIGTLWGTDEAIASRRYINYSNDATDHHINNHYEADTDSWGPWSPPESSGTTNGTQTWANYDVYNYSGELKLAASDPVPIPVEDPDPEPDTPETILSWQKHDAYKPNTKWDGNTFYRVMGGKWVKQDGVVPVE